PELEGLDVDHRDVADPDHAASLIGVLGPDVDVEVLALELLAALLLAQQVDRLATDHASHLAVPRRDPHALSDEHGRVPASHRPNAQIPLAVDVGDVETDLVDVADDRQLGSLG